MNPSIKRLLGALILIGTLGAASVLAVTASAQTPVGATAAYSDTAIFTQATR